MHIPGKTLWHNLKNAVVWQSSEPEKNFISYFLFLLEEEIVAEARAKINNTDPDYKMQEQRQLS